MALAHRSRRGEGPGRDWAIAEGRKDAMTRRLTAVRAVALAAVVVAGTGLTVLEHAAAFGATEYRPDPQ